MLIHEDIQCGQAPQEIWLCGAVNSMPHADKPTASDLNVELLTSHDSQQLCGCREPAGFVQKL